MPAPVSQAPFARVEPFVIVLQILVLQAGFYLMLGVSVALSVGFVLGRAPTLASVFAAEPGHTEALPVVFAHVITAPVSAVLVGYVVCAATQVLDQVATLSIVHVALRVIFFRTFPRNVAFWAAVAFDGFVMIGVGEFVARRRELQQLRHATGTLNANENDEDASVAAMPRASTAAVSHLPPFVVSPAGNSSTSPGGAKATT